MKPAPGKIVIVMILDAHGGLHARPAIITRIWGPDSMKIQATVFPDAVNDGLGKTVGKSSLGYSAAHDENTWHWPGE